MLSVVEWKREKHIHTFIKKPSVIGMPMLSAQERLLYRLFLGKPLWQDFWPEAVAPGKFGENEGQCPEWPQLSNCPADCIGTLAQVGECGAGQVKPA